MKFIITSMELRTEGESRHFLIPDYWVFRFEQIEKPRFLNSTVEIILLASDERVSQWNEAFHKKAELNFDITFKS